MNSMRVNISMEASGPNHINVNKVSPDVARSRPQSVDTSTCRGPCGAPAGSADTPDNHVIKKNH